MSSAVSAVIDVSPDDARVVRTSKLLSKRFPEVSEGALLMHAIVLVSASMSGEYLHHAGKKDLDRLRRARLAMLKFSTEIDKLSPLMQSALISEFRTLNLEISDDLKSRDYPLPPTDRDQLRSATDLVFTAIAGAELRFHLSRRSDGKYWNAIHLIHDARKIWTSITGKNAPPKSLGLETAFAEYLRDVFEGTGVHASIKDAYDAWADYVYGRFSILDRPS